MAKRQIQVAVVEGCEKDRDNLARILHSDPEIELIRTAAFGSDAVSIVERENPDVLIIGSDRPAINGLDAIASIMSTHPLPIVVVCENPGSGENSLADRAMRAGAVAVIEKPRFGCGSESTQALNRLVNTVKLMSEVKVVRRREKRSLAQGKGSTLPARMDRPAKKRQAARIVVVGVSTGGPGVLKSILSSLPASYPIPIVIAQHIAVGFIESMVGWLDLECDLSIRVARNGEPVSAGAAYVAPGGKDIQMAETGRIVLKPSRTKDGPCPSVDRLFQSIADKYGASSIGILLTGMGKDGAQGLKRMREVGAVTIVQDERSSAVFGMPGEAIKLGGAAFVLTPDEIVEKLEELAGIKHVLP